MATGGGAPPCDPQGQKACLTWGSPHLTLGKGGDFFGIFSGLSLKGRGRRVAAGGSGVPLPPGPLPASRASQPLRGRSVPCAPDPKGSGPAPAASGSGHGHSHALSQSPGAPQPSPQALGGGDGLGT